jgi:bacteriophage exclusion system BrxC/D-like protein
MDEHARKLRRIFRYLKRGVFPPESIDEFTVGRAAELSGIERRLDDVQQGSSRHVFIEGDYGRGKSHVLKAIEAVALRKGFAVSWVTLDGQNHAFNHPTRYLHSFLENLRVPRLPIRGLASLVRCWLRGQESVGVVAWVKQSGSWLRYPVLECQRNIDSTEEAPYLDAWLESRNIASKNGKMWFETISQRIHDTAGLVRAAGYSGVVYLFDELETVATLLWGVRQRYLSYEFLNLLVDGRKHPFCFFAFAATPDFGRRLGNDRGYQEYYANEYPEGCRFITKWHESSVDLVQLRRLGSSDVVNLCKRLRSHHEQGFSWSTKGKLSDNFVERFVSQTGRLNMGIRDVIKSFVHLLEISEQYPDVEVEGTLRT